MFLQPVNKDFFDISYSVKGDEIHIRMYVDTDYKLSEYLLQKASSGILSKYYLKFDVHHLPRQKYMEISNSYFEEEENTTGIDIDRLSDSILIKVG